MEPSGSPSHPDRDEAFSRLFQRYYRPVAHFFLNRGFSLEESRDLAQETFLRAYKGIEGFRNESRIETWLFRIANHIGLNARRYRRADKRGQEEISLEEAWERGLPVFSRSQPGHSVPPSQSRSQLEAVLAQERTRKLREAMAELPPKMRRCVLLRVDQGLKYREIAAVTQVSIQTVKAQIYQARKQLEEKLGDYFEELELPAREGGDDE